MEQSEIIRLNNGETSTIMTLNDVEELIKNGFSEDLANLVGCILKNSRGEALKNKEEICSDFYAYELELDKHNVIFNDILDTIYRVKDYLENTQKIDRNKVLNSLEIVTDLIEENI